MSFDYQLTSDADHFPPLPASISSKPTIFGLKRGPNTFLLIKSGLSFSKYLLLEIEFKGGRWLEKATYFKQREPDARSMAAKRRNYRINTHAGRFFKTAFVDESEYEVSVHAPPVKPGEDGEITQILLQSVEQFPRNPFGYRAGMLNSMKTRSGYAVTFQVIAKGKKEPELFVDIFQENGAFVRRLSLEVSPIPCINREEIWIQGQGKNGEEVLQRWDVAMHGPSGE